MCALDSTRPSGPAARAYGDVSIPTAQMFSEGNGGESRKSFHGYPNGYAKSLSAVLLPLVSKPGCVKYQGMLEPQARTAYLEN